MKPLTVRWHSLPYKSITQSRNNKRWITEDKLVQLSVTNVPHATITSYLQLICIKNQKIFALSLTAFWIYRSHRRHQDNHLTHKQSTLPHYLFLNTVEVKLFKLERKFRAVRNMKCSSRFKIKQIQI